MATGLPSYTEDLNYPAYQDRLILNSILQPGVVSKEDLKVLASSGLQVGVQSGKAYIEQTEAIEESSNKFFNGLYFVPISVAAQPYNSVEVSSVNPQIAQIILRVYDVNELKIGGSSFARLEWLNGTPTAAATEAKMKEEVYEGVASLSQSSLRLARVLVPKNATTSSEYYIEDARTFSSKFSLNFTNGSQTTRSVNTNLLVSNTRLGIVTITAQLAENTGIQCVVEGVVVAALENKNAGQITVGTSFPVPPGKFWKGTKIGTNAVTLSASYFLY